MTRQDNEQLFRETDWAASELGPAEDWPVEMRAVVQTVLASGFAMCTAWGLRAIQIYNDAYNPIYGDKHPHAFGRPAIESWPEIWPFLEPALAEVRSTGNALSFEGMLLPLAKHGAPEECYFDFSYSPVRAADAGVIGIVSVAVERTAEVVFARRQKCLDLSLEPGAPTPFHAVTGGLRDRLADNPMDACAAILYAAAAGASALGSPVWSLRASDTLEQLVRGRLDVARHDTVEPLEFDGLDERGAAAARGARMCIVSRTGELLGCLVLLPDPLVPRQSHLDFVRALADRLHAALHRDELQSQALGAVRSELEERDTIYRALFEHMGDAAFYAATDGLPDSPEVVIAANPQACALLGYEASEIVGMQREALFFDADTQLAEAVQERARNRIFVGELELKAKDGRAVPVEISSRLVQLPGGGARSISLVRDIAWRRQREQERAEHVRFDTMVHLTGGIAHDFNNLLTVIIGNLEALQLRLAPDAYEVQLVENAMLGAERAAGLTGQLLAYARRQSLQPQTIDLRHFLNETRGLIQSSLGEINRLVIDGGEGSFVCRVDPAQLTTAILNLSSNARDAMQGGGTFTLSVRRLQLPQERTADNQRLAFGGAKGNYVVLTAQDSGSGMSAEVLSRIFEPFFTTKDIGRGTGLGLPMVQGLMRQSGGDVQVLSQPGAGTRFELLFPEVAMDVDAGTALPLLFEHRGQRILLVEDNDLVRDQVHRMLAAAGFTIVEAQDAREALALFAQQGDAVDLILSDFMMPGGMSGAELVRALRKQRPDLPALLMSGYAPDSGKAGDAALDYAMLPKPFNRQTLLSAVLRQLSRPGA